MLQLEKQNKQIQAELQATKKAHNESEISFYSVQRERDVFKMNFEKAEKMLMEHGIEFLADGMEEMHKKTVIEEYSGRE